MATVDARTWSKTNLWRLPSGELGVRPGFRRIYTPEAGRLLVAGFSVANRYSGELWHYVFDVADSGRRDLKLRILDDNHVTFQVLSLNVDVIPRVITHASVEGHLMFGSPDMPTLHGLIGNAMSVAVKVDRGNGSATAIEIPRGLVCAVLNRICIASGPLVYISDPVSSSGGSPKTFVAQNINGRPGTIFGLHEGAGDRLVAVTSAGTYGLGADAFAVGIVGSNGSPWSLLSHCGAQSFASSCTVRGRVIALTRLGWMHVDVEDAPEQRLSEPVMSRAYGPRASLQDCRDARIYGSEDGPIVAVDALNAIHRTSADGEVASWWKSSHSPTNFRVRGLMKGPAGEDQLLCENGIFALAGNFDGEIALSSAVATQPKGILAGVVPSTPKENPTVRAVHVKAEAGGSSGGRVYCAVRGLAGTPTRPAADVKGLIIGTDAWGVAAPKRYTATPMASVRFDFNELTRDVGIEVGVEHPLARIWPVIDVEYSASAADRAGKVAA